MRIQDHLGKLSWTLADKALYVGYGFVNLLQITALPPEEFALYALVSGLYLFAVSLSDTSILQTVIMFGGGGSNSSVSNIARRGAVNRFALGWHSVWILVWSGVCYALSGVIAQFLGEPRLAGMLVFVPVLCVAALPRMFILKMLYRDVQARQIFILNAVWFGTMTLLSAWMLASGRLRNFGDMMLIAVLGLLASSLVALVVGRRYLVFAVEERLDLKELRSFVTYQSAISVAGNSLKQLDIYLVQYFFGMVTVGVYQSAKTLFRFVDEAFSALIGLLYPGAVRLIGERRDADLRALLSKAVSFTFVAMLCMALVATLGGSHLLITTLLPAKYHAASGYFTGLVWAAPCLAFSMLAVVVIAFGESRRLLGYMLVAGAVGMLVLVLVGVLGRQDLVPFGFVVYHALLGVLVLRFIRRRIDFPLVLVLRCVPDVWNFLVLRFGGK